MPSPKHVEPEHWTPPVPEAERMRGLDAEDIYTVEQIDFMRKLAFKAKPEPQVRTEKMASNYSNDAPPVKGEVHSGAVNIDARNETVLDNGVLKKKDLERQVVREFVSVSRHLDDDFVELLLAEARHRARIPVFLDRVSNSANSPMQYADSPRSLRLPDFIQQEWIDKGFKPKEIDRQMLAEYDKKLVRAIENYEYNHGLLAENMRFPKVGNKRSKREMEPHPD